MEKSKGREHYPSQHPWMKDVKRFGVRKNRQTTRWLLYQERYDDFPTNKPVDTEDPWDGIDTC